MLLEPVPVNVVVNLPVKLSKGLVAVGVGVVVGVCVFVGVCVGVSVFVGVCVGVGVCVAVDDGVGGGVGGTYPPNV